MSLQTDIYRRSLGLEQGGSTGSEEIDELLSVAQSHGGSVAQVATEIAHPNASILRRFQQKLGGAFTGLMNTLMIPQNAVASLASQFSTDPISFEEARKEHVAPSDIFFGDSKESKPETIAGKVGMFTARLATDILLDPLTYVTFGTTSGVLGISKLTSIPLKESTATQLGLKTMEFSIDGKVVKEAVKHRSLSEEGLENYNKVVKRIEDQIVKDTVGDFHSSKMVHNRLQSLTDRLRNKSTAEIDEFIKPIIGREFVSRAGRQVRVITGESTSGAEFILAQELKKIPEQLGDLTDAARSTKQEALEKIAMQKAMAEQSDRLARHTLQARRADIDDKAKTLISNLIERNVERGGVMLDRLGNPLRDQTGALMRKNLARDWIDQGGIKMFGKTVLAGSHIRQIARMIPLLSSVDRATVGARNVFGSLFSTKWTIEGRAPDTLIQLSERAKNRREVATTELLASIPKLFEKLGITKEEDKLISEAIVLDMPPAANPTDNRLETLWTLIHAREGQQVAKDIADGKYGEDVVRMWTAANAINKQLRSNLILMHESGIATYPAKNYLPGITLPQKKLLNPYSKFRTAKAVNAEKAELVKFRNVDSPEEVLYGSEKDLRLERLSKVEERQRIESEILKNVMSVRAEKEAITKEIDELWTAINKKMQDTIIKGSKEAFKGISDDANNMKALYTVLKEAIPEVDKKKILQKHAEKRYEDGKKLVQDSKLTGEDLDKLMDKLDDSDEELNEIAEKMISNMRKFKLPPKSKSKVAEEATSDDQKALKELMKMVQDAGMEMKEDFLREALTKDDVFMGVLRGMAHKWQKDPQGISRTVEKILGSEFKLSSLMSDLSDTITGLKIELNNPGLKKVADRWFYKDKEDKIYERVRATAKEINDNLFKGEEIFSESALRSSLVGSLTAIRASVSKDFLDDIVSRFGIESGSQPSNFVRVGVSGLGEKAKELKDIIPMKDNELVFKNAQGKEVFFHPTIAEYIVNSLKIMSEDPASSEMVKIFDDFLRVWKASVTSIWPAFHGRNAISNVLQNMLDIGRESLNPTNHIMSVEMIKYGHDLEKFALEATEGSIESMNKLIELEKKIIFTDNKGYDWSVGELYKVIKDNVVAYNPNLVGQIDVRKTPIEAIDSMQSKLFDKPNKWGGYNINPLSVEFTPYQYGIRMGNIVESHARLLNFLTNLKKTGNVEHAAFQTKQFLFDYQNLTHFERNVMKRLLPFYTFSRKNLELQIKTLLTKPGRISSQFTAVRTVSDVFGGGSLTDDEIDNLPKWMRDSHSLVFNRDKNIITTVSTLGTPLEQPFEQLSNVVGGFNPLIKGPIELMTNYSFFHGRPISQVTDATAFSSPLVPQAIKDFIGYSTFSYTDKSGIERTLHIALRPRNMHVFSMMPLTGRTLSSLKLMETDRVPDQIKWMQFIFGIKPGDIDIQLEGERQEKELKEQIEHILDEAGLGYTFSRFTLTDKE